MESREIATRVITEVLISKKHLDSTLEKYFDPQNDIRTKSLTREICYGVMRWYFQLEFIINDLVSTPLKRKDTDLFALLLTGIYQIKFLRTPDYAAINESVETTKIIGKPWAAKLVNAVLRNYQRNREKINKKILDSETTKYAYPDWMLKKIESQWPDHWEKILSASNDYPPMHLRLNTSILSRDEYIDNIKAKGIDAEISTTVSSGVRLNEPLDVEAVPGFTDGYVSVQDFGAQLAAPLLDCRPGDRVLDACAAPGGKTGHILEIAPHLNELIAIDLEPHRLALLSQNLNRIKKKPTIHQADVRDTKCWWDNVPFDRILLDAPCSASGVIRRHPDIKYLRSQLQLDNILSTQIQLLEALWSVLKSGGKLVYCSCSIFKEETEEQIAHFINQYNNVRLLPIEAKWGVYSRYGRQTLPGYDESDGFFYSVLEKT